MNRVASIRTVCALVGGVSMTLVLGGCVSSPTYGTHKTANQHLIDGLTSMVSIAPPKKDSKVTYKPRPDLVDPPEGTPLPPPQSSLASKENPQWPESPEETRARLIAEADNDTNPIDRGGPLSTPAESSEQFRKFREARANQKASYEGRRYLSDPPVEYRVPADTAPADELGETEFKKEQRRKAAARKEKGGFKIWPF